MSSLGKVTNSLVSASNETSLALANLQYDFSLIKVEAPVEYTALGSALSSKRRCEAEAGPQHKTARRLAAIFEQLVPPTPKLIAAYGQRVSEIIQKPGVNPAGSKTH